MIGVSDISCDLHGSVEFLSRITSVEKPYFGTNPATGEGQTDMDENRETRAETLESTVGSCTKAGSETPIIPGS